MTGVLQDASLLEIRASDSHLTILLDAGDGPVLVELELQPATAHALRHINALDEHSDGRDIDVEVHVDLLRRCLGSLGVLALAIVVRSVTPVGFYLRLLRPCAGEIHLDLNVLDGVCLLLSPRLPIQLERDQTRDWDVALRRLILQGQHHHREENAGNDGSW